MTDISIFDGEHRLIIDKPLRLIELFAGYGSQSLALKYLGIPHEHYFISEWAVKSIQAYKDMHCPDDNSPYDAVFSDKEIRQRLYGRISNDYSTPLTDEQIDRMPIDKARTIVRNMFATHNQGSICSINAKEHPIYGDYTYLLTYSFPCQDLSMAGLRQGMERGSSTRSGLLWEVERLLNEWNSIGKMPDILLMENVPEVVGTKNRSAWEEWIASLDQLGYKSYWKILNATEYGIPQNRRRCFMVSVQGNYYYDHPEAIGCPIRLKDALEPVENIDEEYYLSDEFIDALCKWSARQKANGNGFSFNPVKREDAERATCISTADGNRGVGNFIDESQSMPIVNSTTQGYENAYPGDCVDLRQPKCNSRRGRVQHERSQTLPLGSSVTTPICADVGSVCERPGYRIRKLTEKECFRLMGVKDEDSERVHKNQSKSSMYHLAGDSIVTACLMALFGEMFAMDWRAKSKSYKRT